MFLPLVIKKIILTISFLSDYLFDFNKNDFFTWKEFYKVVVFCGQNF